MPIIADTYAAEGPTLDQLIDEIVHNAQGFAIAPDRLYALSQPVGATDTTLVIEGAQAPGVYEVENELVYVTAVDTGTGACTVPGYGRGFKGTTATTHAAGVMVALDPVFPRKRVADAVNDVVSSLYPRLYAVGATTATVGETWTVELPADAEDVLDVRYLDIITEEWKRVRTWEAENTAADTLTGKAVLVPTLNSGDQVQVSYSVRPERFATGDQFWSETGLPLPLKDVVQTGALARLVKYIDIGRFTDRAVSPRPTAQQPQISVGMQLSRSLMQDFEAQVDREALALRHRYPARQHFTR